MDDPKSQFATRLRAVREAAELSQEEVARGLGVSLRTYHNWEHGRGSPQAWRIPTFCDVLKCERGDLLPS